MKTTIITLNEAIRRGNLDWGCDNDCEFHGIIPGYLCGFNLEIIKDGKINYGSCVFTNDFDEIRNPNEKRNWNDLGISEDLCNSNGWQATGNIVFRGYFKQQYDYKEREAFVYDASEEVEALLHKYMTGTR